MTGRDREATTASPVPVTIFSRPGCHLCDELKTVVLRVGQSVPMAVEEIDISSDPVLEDRYGLEIPVLIVAGKKAAKYRISEEELRRVLAARREWRDGQEDQ